MSQENTLTIGAMIISGTDGSVSLYGDRSPINILSTGGQTIAATFSFIPGATIATSPAAAVLTFGKIIIDTNNGSQVSAGDILSISGNVVGVIGAVGVLAGVSGVAIPGAAIGLALGGLGALANTPWGQEAMNSLREWILNSGAKNSSATLNDVNLGSVGITDFDFWRIPNSKISNSTNQFFNAARGWTPPRDPLVLDLDGDGIEAFGIDTAHPILFDHDGDGTRNATGWIGPDDGIVVLDRNGNGVIDSGRELFGDQTLKPDTGDGQRHTYANGYEALAAQDTNGDGVIDAHDAVYDQLRIWKDTNQDGISQAGELHRLADLGIASIDVAGKASSVDLGHGNTQPWSGSFTRTDGKSDVVLN